MSQRMSATAFLALWNSISSSAFQGEYESWHTFEHVPERVGLPGFIEAVRYRSVTGLGADAAPNYFTCYWLADINALGSSEYSDVVANPTPWSARMRRELRDFVRMPCMLGGAAGQSSASQLATCCFTGDSQALSALAADELPQRVRRGEVVSAQWGAMSQTESIPAFTTFATSSTSPAAHRHPAQSANFVVMLQGLDTAALKVTAAQVAGALSVIRPGGSGICVHTAMFEQSSRVRQADLTEAPGRRPPPRNDLFRQFQPFQQETNHAH